MLGVPRGVREPGPRRVCFQSPPLAQPLVLPLRVAAGGLSC